MLEHDAAGSDNSNMQMSNILGVNVNVINEAQALQTIEEFILSGKPHIVVTADASAVVIAQGDEELMEIINSADLVTPDGAGILWASKHLGTPLPERVSGVDMVQKLCERGAETGHKPFLLGAAPGIAEEAAYALQQKYPGLQVAGTHHGFFAPEESDALVRKIRECKPDMLFVAMGQPRQEKWIRENMEAIGVPVSMGVGGTFDVLSGRVKRAPVWMQRSGLEWIYRLARNPRKIGKCSTLPVFVMKVLATCRQRKRK